MRLSTSCQMHSSEGSVDHPVQSRHKDVGEMEIDLRWALHSSDGLSVDNWEIELEC